MKKTLLLIVLVIIAIIAFFALKEETNAPTIDNSLSPSPSAEMSVPPDTSPANNISSNQNKEDMDDQVQIIIYSNSGFSPSTANVSSGTTVKFVNNSSSSMWPASAVHPTHRLYPGSDILKCGTDETGLIFDACRGIGAEQSWSFTFTNKGTWKYHDHIRASQTGTIIVN